MEAIKGFKVFNPDWTCRGFQYEVGQTYKENVTPSVCDRGFHFCKQPKDCFNYYRFDPDNKVAEVVAIGEVSEEGDKCSTNKIQIVREIPWSELLTLVNLGKGNVGLCNSGNWNSGDCNSGNRNSGDWNSGNWNSGDCNSGNRNSGDWNSGNRNSGDCNSGDWNSGDWNSGDCNSGNRNSGDCNSGNRNSGDCNSGNRNSGDCNSGDCNSGNRNSGDCNSGNRNSGDCNSGDCNSGNRNSGDWNKSSFNAGCFNTEQHKLKFFDKETDMTMQEWWNSDARYLLNDIDFRPTEWIYLEDMSDEEKEQHPESKTTGGYLKNRDNTDACIKWWDELSEIRRNIIRSIPNFDANKFYEITGIKA